uniref:SCP domain-containing protein n=1 Tax=Strongyloides papillosus TaxID=174720 RepID=A0A0N5C062_STREA
MVKTILKEKYTDKIEDVCIYNSGHRKRNMIVKVIVPKCESILPYVYQHYSSTKIDVINPSTYGEDVYSCNNRIFYDFESALDYALKTRSYITFNPRGGSPIPPLRDFCILTRYGRICQMKNSPLPNHWKKIWSNCNSDCYFYKNFIIAKKNYLEEINFNRKIYKDLPLTLNAKLSELAQRCANLMAKLKRLRSEQTKNINEIVAYAPNANGMYLMKLLFEDSYVNRNTNKILPKNSKIGQLLSPKQKFIGIGMTKEGSGVFICLKYTSMRV